MLCCVINLVVILEQGHIYNPRVLPFSYTKEVCPLYIMNQLLPCCTMFIPSAKDFINKKGIVVDVLNSYCHYCGKKTIVRKYVFNNNLPNNSKVAKLAPLP